MYPTGLEYLKPNWKQRGSAPPRTSGNTATLLCTCGPMRACVGCARDVHGICVGLCAAQHCNALTNASFRRSLLQVYDIEAAKYHRTLNFPMNRSGLNSGDKQRRDHEFASGRSAGHAGEGHGSSVAEDARNAGDADGSSNRACDDDNGGEDDTPSSSEPLLPAPPATPPEAFEASAEGSAAESDPLLSSGSAAGSEASAELDHAPKRKRGADGAQQGPEGAVEDAVGGREVGGGVRDIAGKGGTAAATETDPAADSRQGKSRKVGRDTRRSSSGLGWRWVGEPLPPNVDTIGEGRTYYSQVVLHTLRARLDRCLPLLRGVRFAVRCCCY